MRRIESGGGREEVEKREEGKKTERKGEAKKEMRGGIGLVKGEEGEEEAASSISKFLFST